MPKRASLKDADAANGSTIHEEPRTNGINEAQLKGFVSEYENEAAEIDRILEEARVACQPHVDQQKAIAKQAAESGIEKKTFKAKLRERQLRRKADGCRSVLSERQQEVFDEISLKLNDLARDVGPLGEAALSAHKKAGPAAAAAAH